MIQGDKDPLNTILRSKRETSRFQILVEIAEHQPAVRQLEIADKLGVTPQAISDHMRELVEEGLITMSGRSNYMVTKTGIAWVMEHATTLESYIRHIRLDIIQYISVWTAFAAEDLKSGDIVGLYMKDGYLYAGKKPRSATATVYADAQKNEDVGIADINGIIDHHEGTIHVCKVPRIQHGGSRRVDKDKLKEIVAMTRMTAAVGIEASVALKSIGRNPDMFFGAGDGVIDAALHGITCAIVIVDNDFTNFIKRLENTSLEYVIHDLTTQ
ncbi:MAG: winged helix-turn-helix transcriptional regulator [Methanoregula sp.]|nr:winged helix-turn-helix transcriptional regulator [Methanoregula sp.]